MDEARKRVNRMLRRTFNRSQILCPVNTGYMRSTGKQNLTPRGSSYVGSIEYTAEYAAAVHNGRRAMTIRAKGKGRMRFTVDGRVVFARVVHQPARRGRPFLAQALREVAPMEGFRIVSIG
jgi:hypothetical protein